MLVLNVLTPDSLNFDMWGWDSRSAAIAYVPSWVLTHVARVIRVVWLYAPKACNSLHSSAAASVLVLTGVDGIFMPETE